MNLFRTDRLLLSGAVLCTVLGAVATQPAAAQQGSAVRPVLAVHADRPGARISPLLYGIFFEEINHAGDGGLYAELVRNRSFEDADRPEAWEPVADKDGEAALELDRSRPLNSANPRCLRIEAAPAAGGRAGASNGGYWGIAARKGATYNLSLYARRDAGLTGPLTATLEGENGQVYGKATVNGLATDWKRHTAKLTANADDPKARLVLTVASPGTLWLDMVSLFPADTFKGRPNGCLLYTSRCV